jgi:hypothetical protein
MPGQTELHFQNGRVIERWSTTGFLRLMVQIGAIPQPGAWDAAYAGENFQAPLT